MRFIISVVFAAVFVGAVLAGAAAAADDPAPPACPHCGADADVIPIIYGFPSQELMAAAERGEVALGG